MMTLCYNRSVYYYFRSNKYERMRHCPARIEDTKHNRQCIYKTVNAVIRLLIQENNPLFFTLFIPDNKS